MTHHPEQTGDIVLAHLSDPHLPLGPETPWRSMLNKRALSLLSWQRKRRHLHRPEILLRLVEDLQAQAPDLIAVTGDLTNLGLVAEFERARRWLDGLGDPARVSVIPGNHDALVSGAWEAGAPHWRPFWQGDETPEAMAPQDAFPTLRRRGPLALIGVSSAVPSAPGLAVGAVGAPQIARLAILLRQTRDAELCRVVMIHHPPLEGTVRARKALRDAAAFRAVLAREGAELVLHGHSHKSHVQSLSAQAGAVPVIGVPSASSMHGEAAAYHLYRIARTSAGWSIAVTARRLRADGRVETGQGITLDLRRAHAT